MSETTIGILIGVGMGQALFAFYLTLAKRWRREWWLWFLWPVATLWGVINLKRVLRGDRIWGFRD